jgi:2'-5' RNA ligase
VTPEDTAFGAALWLVPEGAAYEQLSARIDALALRHGSPRFPPHVTLLGGFTGDVAEVLAATARMASATAPFTVRLVAAVVRDEYFRRLVLEVEPTEELNAARARAAAALTRPAAGFEPHLSLLYGRAEVTSEGAVSDWQPLGRLLLGSGEMA